MSDDDGTQQEFYELEMLRAFYKTWKVLHMDPERRVKLQAALRLIDLSHQYDSQFAKPVENKIRQALKLVHG